MRELNVAAFQCLDQLHIVVARHTECLAATNHRHRQTEYAGGCGAAIDKIADKDQFASVRRGNGKFVVFSSDGVAKLGHQLQQFIEAAMHIANDVEWPMFVPPVVPKRCALDGDCFHFFRSGELEDVAKTLALQATQRAPHLLCLIANHVRTELPVGAGNVPLVAQLLRQVKDDCSRQNVVLPRKLDQRLAGLRLHVGRVNDCQPSERKPLAHDRMQQIERCVGYRLVVFVVGDESTACVGRNDFGRQKMPAAKDWICRSRMGR